MKIRKNLLLIVAIMFSMTSCSLLSGTSSSNTNPTTSSQSSNSSTYGTELGYSMKSLYGQYKADGSLDFTNLSNLMAMQKIVNNSAIYKQNYKDPSFIGAFTTGLITGSENLVNKSNKSSVLTSLMNIANSGASTQESVTGYNVANTVSNVSKASTGINTLMSLFK